MGVSATQATGNTGMRLPGICRKEATSSSDQAQHHHFLQLFAPPPPLQLCPFPASAADVICQSSGFTLYHIASYSLGCPLTAIVLLGTSPALSLTVRQHTRSCKAPVLVIMGSAGGPRRGGGGGGKLVCACLLPSLRPSPSPARWTCSWEKCLPHFQPSPNPDYSHPNSSCQSHQPGRSVNPPEGEDAMPTLPVA